LWFALEITPALIKLRRASAKQDKVPNNGELRKKENTSMTINQLKPLIYLNVLNALKLK
jgi:hypothetical protein